MMKSVSRSSTLYERLITVSFLLLLKSSGLFQALADQAASTPELIQNAKVQDGLAHIIETVEICGSGLRRLPEPPSGAEAADQRFRELGNDICQLAKLLEELTATNDPSVKKHRLQDIPPLIGQAKKDFHESILLFEQVFPGRLSRALQIDR